MLLLHRKRVAGREEDLPVSARDKSIFTMGPREFKLFRTLIHQRAGIWLRDGKQVMLASRLSQRLRHHGIENFSDYYSFVENIHGDGAEMRELINCVTTNKTSFFRERHHFDFLANSVVPEIDSAARPGVVRRLRIWSAASSTGEEAYSIAITLLETLRSSARVITSVPLPDREMRAGASVTGSIPIEWKIEIIASDIDTRVLAAAQRAIYNSESLESIAPALRKRYFLRGKDDMLGKVRVKQDVVRLVQFQRINLNDSQWPIDGLFDVIFFRNALIYFNRRTQDVFLRKMVDRLNVRGYLFLGNAEHIPWLNNILEPLSHTMYRLRDVRR